MAGDERRKIRIAITGGGFAGAIIARSLLKCPQFDVRIYESASSFRERGAAVGLAVNALRSLEMIDPQLRKALDAAGGVPSNATKTLLGEGSQAGETIIDLATIIGSSSNPNEIIVHRAHFLRELLKDVPESVMQVNKKLVRIDELAPSHAGAQPSLRLHFGDGSRGEVDALIGADGVHGYVRGYVLQNDAATMPVYAGWWDCRNLVPISKGINAIGSQYVDPNNARQHAWIGDGGLLMHDIVDNGETLQCVASVRDERDWDASQWKRSLSGAELRARFGDWLIGKQMSGLLSDGNTELQAFSQWEHKDASRFFKGNVCMMGDAAHAMVPWQGSGAGQAIEDALILQKLLIKVHDPSSVAKAFEAYDAVRRPRAQKIVKSSHETGLILTGQDPSIGMDPQKLREALAPRWTFIHMVDLAAMVKEAEDIFERLCST